MHGASEEKRKRRETGREGRGRRENGLLRRDT